MALKPLFQKDVRYVIPTFQRPYVSYLRTWLTRGAG
jgi:hypothetical protein